MYANKNISANGNQRTAFSLFQSFSTPHQVTLPDRYHENLNPTGADSALISPYLRI
ncbi:hypothetical protein ymoll0001_3960 [Yersinia mollaretii ATCC 43969]|uniref:Uncharacterized protein n=1 Tax=Yersinia mollaretii (strain ATCC 43969 / DSM 18520 / CIP 103324 / CNY 7263 / WAIP 204) TaxID=349967 RepID=A0ABM9YD09_YERMW|nr:hypothetical protein ymoll0001_3960 [Yersinia mollaretii ATCC 43969]